MVTLTEKIKQKAMQIGFDLVGMTSAGQISDFHREKLKSWIEAKHPGQMEYMYRNFDKRCEPGLLLKGAKSVIAVGLNYAHRELENSLYSEKKGVIARYARHADYHKFIKQRLFELAEFIDSQTEKKGRFKVCVDSVPLAERAIGQRAGLGFIGKNHMLTNPEIGSQILLGEIITDLQLDYDKEVTADCRGCDRCIKACPTGALGDDGDFDANKCISYLTIEYKGQIAGGLAGKMGNRIFGCDQCVMVCPYNQKGALECKNSDFEYRSEWAQIGLEEILAMDEADFQRRFADSAMIRTGLESLKRNAKICLYNAV